MNDFNTHLSTLLDGSASRREPFSVRPNVDVPHRDARRRRFGSKGEACRSMRGKPFR